MQAYSAAIRRIKIFTPLTKSDNSTNSNDRPNLNFLKCVMYLIFAFGGRSNWITPTGHLFCAHYLIKSVSNEMTNLTSG